MIHKKIELWNKDEYAGVDKLFTPTLETYIIKGDKPKGAILIMPGGGYAQTSGREAKPVALWVNSIGYNAFVLHYSVAPNRHPQPLLDATRAMCVIRENSDAWRVNPEKIAVCGFSAGGHLAASLGVYYNASYLQNVVGMKEGKNRPNALILCYPVISGEHFPHLGSYKNLLGENPSEKQMFEMSLEKHVTSSTPPSFIWSTFNDACVPVQNSLTFAYALKSKSIPFELHIFPDGPHGLSLCNEQTANGNERLINPQVSVWTRLCEQWLKFLAF